LSHSFSQCLTESHPLADSLTAHLPPFILLATKRRYLEAFHSFTHKRN